MKMIDRGYCSKCHEVRLKIVGHCWLTIVVNMVLASVLVGLVAIVSNATK